MMREPPAALPAGAATAPAPPLRGPCRVSLDVFEGPLDLLLHLIKKNEVAIADIPVARITEQYLAYLDMMRDLDLDIAGEYLVMAATLVLIKSRMLLPAAEDEPEEEADPRADLVRQLLEYQRYREAALALAERPLLQRDVFAREPVADVEGAGADPGPRLRVSPWDLLAALQAVLRRARPEPVHEVVVERVSLRDRAERLLARLRHERTVAFESLFDEAATRLEIVVTFLALLELMRLGGVRAVQSALFDRIVIELAVDDPATLSFDRLDEYDGARVGAGAADAPADAAPAAEADAAPGE